MHPVTELTMLIYLMGATIVVLAFGDAEWQFAVMLFAIGYAVFGIIAHRQAVQNGSEESWFG